MGEESWVRSEIKEIVFYLFIAGLVLLIPTLVGLAGGQYSESFVKGEAITFGTYLATFTIYIPLLILAMLCIIFPIARLVSLKRNEDPVTKPNPSWFRIFTMSYIHAPEENGLLYYASEQSGFKGNKNLFKWMKNPLKLFMASILLFGVFGLLLLFNPQWAVASVPPSSLQQITVGSEVTFGSLIPAFAENGTILFLFMIVMGILAYICAKFKLGRWAYFGIAILLCIIFFSFAWASLHSIVYGNSNIAYTNTMIFGGISLLLTLLCGSFIPFFCFHIFNNLFILLGKLVTLKNDVIFITVIILFLIFVIWLGRAIYRFKHKIKESEYSIPQA